MVNTAIQYPLNDRFWTQNYHYDSNKNQSELTLYKWSCHGSGVWWWLWLATAGGVAGVIYEVRRGRQTRPAKSPHPA